MALRRDDIGGLHRPWWANFTAFAFVVRAYENPAIYRCGARPIQGPGRGRAVPGGISYVMRLAFTGSETHALRLEAACISTCGTLAGVPGVVHTCSGVTRRVHRSVDGSLYPLKITFLMYFTAHLSLSKVTVHPTLHSTLIPNKDAILFQAQYAPSTQWGGQVS